MSFESPGEQLLTTSGACFAGGPTTSSGDNGEVEGPLVATLGLTRDGRMGRHGVLLDFKVKHLFEADLKINIFRVCTQPVPFCASVSLC